MIEPTIPFFPQTNPPDVIYHYCSMETFVKIVESKTLWLTSSTKMNDVAECRWLLSLLAQYAHSYLYDSSENIELANFILDRTSLNSPPSYMACFSQEKDLLSQWRGYADAGKGVAIGFSLASFKSDHIKIIDSEALPSQNCYYMCQVIYTNAEEISTWLKAIIDNAKINNILKDYIPLLLSSIRALFKSDSFSEEKEWRLVIEPDIFKKHNANVYTTTLDIDTFKTRLTQRGLSLYIPYQIIEENKPKIVEVILGPQNQTSEWDLGFFLFNNGLAGVNVERSSSTFRG